MALIECPGCTQIVSDTAESCPRCGYGVAKVIAQQDRAMGGLVIAGLFVAVLLIGSIVSLVRGPTTMPVAEPTSSPALAPEIMAAVRFTGRQFVITNLDGFEWTNVKIEVNGRLFSDGYILRAALMEPNTIYRVGALQFAKADGGRLNPFTTKPVTISIRCDTPNGRAEWQGNF